MSQFNMTSSLVPTLDLGSSINSYDDWVNLASSLNESLLSQGYVYLINHGIPTETISAGFEKTKDFFNLPRTTKEKYLKPPQVVTYHGYNAKYAKEKISDCQVLLREYFHAWDHQDNAAVVYPSEIQGFDSSIQTLLYGRPMRNLNRILLKLLSRICNAEDAGESWNLESVHQGFSSNSPIGNYSYFSSMFYPGIPEEIEIREERGSVRCSAHTDCSTYTLLFLDDVGGLQKKNADGQWEDIPLLKEGILLITGDFLEAITGGKIPALVHRVPTPTPTDLRKREERQSMPVYILPDNDTRFTPLNSTEISFGEYYEELIKKRYFRQ